jgi:hypothetical protein
MGKSNLRKGEGKLSKVYIAYGVRLPCCLAPVMLIRSSSHKRVAHLTGRTFSHLRDVCALRMAPEHLISVAEKTDVPYVTKDLRFPHWREVTLVGADHSSSSCSPSPADPKRAAQAGTRQRSAGSRKGSSGNGAGT